MKDGAPVLVLTLLLAIGMIPFVPQVATAQDDEDDFTFCGAEQYGVTLRFHNPDLNPWNDPVPEDHPYHDSGLPQSPQIVESSWQFFIHFQAVVDELHDNAPALDDIQSFWFAFGPIDRAAVVDQFNNCEKPWAPGLQLYSYRGDADPSDGFFVPINTTGVSDGTYGAAVYACTAQQYDACQPGGADGGGNPNLVAAAWTRATVYNGQDQCDSDDLACQRQQDFIKPWPVILPGDGEQTGSVDGLTIEFAERLARDEASAAPGGKAVRVLVNGVDRTDELTFWEPPDRDNDLILGNDGDHTGHPLSDCGPLEPAQEVTGQVHPILRLCQKVKWGDGFLLPIDVQENDEIRVWAKDGAGNTAEKVISFRDATRGGVVPFIRADVQVTVEPEELRVRPGDKKVFLVTLENTAEDTGDERQRQRDTAHVFPHIVTPDALEAQLGSDHIDIAPGKNVTVPLQAGPTADAEEGDYPFEVLFRYLAGQRMQERKVFPRVVADESASLSADDSGSDGGGGGSGGGGGPQAGGGGTGPVPTGFVRKCQEKADHQVCYVYPDPLQADDPFTFEVEVSESAEAAVQRHQVDAGEASLTLQYLSADRSNKLAEDATYDMEQVSIGRYRTEVTLSGLAPVINAAFDSEVVDISMLVREPAEASQQGGAGLPTPGFGAVALVAALGAAAFLLKRRP